MAKAPKSTDSQIYLAYRPRSTKNIPQFPTPAKIYLVEVKYGETKPICRLTLPPSLLIRFSAHRRGRGGGGYRPPWEINENANEKKNQSTGLLLIHSAILKVFDSY